MKLSSKGRVAVTSLVDMAVYSKNDNPVKLSDISKRQNISLAFLEQIFFLLKKRGIVQSTRGPLGGYSFAKNPEMVNLYDVISAIDEEFKINNCNGVDYGCISSNGKKSKCLTHNLWYEFRNHILSFLTSISIEDVKLNNIFIKNEENMEKSSVNNHMRN